MTPSGVVVGGVKTIPAGTNQVYTLTTGGGRTLQSSNIEFLKSKQLAEGGNIVYGQVNPTVTPPTSQAYIPKGTSNPIFGDMPLKQDLPVSSAFARKLSQSEPVTVYTNQQGKVVSIDRPQEVLPQLKTYTGTVSRSRTFTQSVVEDVKNLSKDRGFVFNSIVSATSGRPTEIIGRLPTLPAIEEYKARKFFSTREGAIEQSTGGFNFGVASKSALGSSLGIVSNPTERTIFTISTVSPTLKLSSGGGLVNQARRSFYSDIAEKGLISYGAVYGAKALQSGESPSSLVGQSVPYVIGGGVTTKIVDRVSSKSGKGNLPDIQRPMYASEELPFYGLPTDSFRARKVYVGVKDVKIGTGELSSSLTGYKQVKPTMFQKLAGSASKLDVFVPSKEGKPLSFGGRDLEVKFGASEFVNYEQIKPTGYVSIPLKGNYKVGAKGLDAIAPVNKGSLVIPYTVFRTALSKYQSGARSVTYSKPFGVNFGSELKVGGVVRRVNSGLVTINRGLPTTMRQARYLRTLDLIKTIDIKFYSYSKGSKPYSKIKSSKNFGFETVSDKGLVSKSKSKSKTKTGTEDYLYVPEEYKTSNKPGGKSKGTTNIKPISMTPVFPSSSSKSFSGYELINPSKTIYEPSTITIPKVRLDNKKVTIQETKIIQKYFTKQKIQTPELIRFQNFNYYTDTSTGGETVRIPKIPQLPNIRLSIGGGGGGGYRLKSAFRIRQPKRYTPSAYALGFNIRGKRPSKSAIKTGLVIRPITI